jgi:hypothetical protein
MEVKMTITRIMKVELCKSGIKIQSTKHAIYNIWSTNEELLERKSSGTSLENREYGRRDPSH